MDLRFPPEQLGEILGRPVRFERVTMRPTESGFELGMERSLAGFPITLGLDYEPVPRARGLELKLTSARLGSLKIPTVLAGPIEKLFEPVVGGLSSELDTLQNLRNVSITEPSAHLIF